MQTNFKVNKIEAEAFAKVWNRGGITILLDDNSVQFATDFANVVLRNFIEMCQKQIQQAQEKTQEKKLIVEGL